MLGNKAQGDLGELHFRNECIANYNELVSIIGQQTLDYMVPFLPSPNTMCLD